MQFLKRFFKRWLLQKGAILSRPPGQFELTSWKLAELKRRGLRVDMAVDGGAAEGLWATEFMKIFPDARLLCIEPRHEANLRLKARLSGSTTVTQVQALLGRKSGQGRLFVAGHQSSMFHNPDGTTVGEGIEARTESLDSLIRSMQTGWPQLIKLDLQGAELMALEGAAGCLQHVEALILEVSFLPIYRGAPLFDEIYEFVRRSDLRIADLLSISHRPLDGAMAQGDVLFLRSTSPLFSIHGWSRNGSL